ncbi:MAG TPA: cytochrome c-type biogenesis protein [Xanthobacteraceae bacterium]
MAVKKLLAVALLFGLLSPTPLLAVQPDEMLSNPVQEARARALSRELRCMVCQNESIDDSEAPLAHDLRVLVRERIKAGDSDAQIIDFLVARYGEFVLLKPRLSWHTALLWGLPPALLLVGGALVVVSLTRRSRALGGESAKLSNVEEKQLANILGEGHSS